jgi:hypothetical protein
MELMALATLGGVMRCPTMLQLHCRVTPSLMIVSKLLALAMISPRVWLKQRAALMEKSLITAALLLAGVRRVITWPAAARLLKRHWSMEESEARLAPTTARAGAGCRRLRLTT